MKTFRAPTGVLRELWVPVLIVVVWFVVSQQSTSIYFPPLADILNELWIILTQRFASDIVPSLSNFAIGLAIAIVVGIGVGVFLGLNRMLNRAVHPLLEFARAVPGIAIVPIALFIFGIGSPMKIAVIAFGALWPILLSTIDGIRSVDPLVLDVSRTMRLRRGLHLRQVVFPSALPQIMAGLRISISLGIILILASEYFASTEGIGYIELQAARQYQLAVMWAALLLLGILGYLVNLAFRVVEHRVLRWHRGLRGLSS